MPHIKTLIPKSTTMNKQLLDQLKRLDTKHRPSKQKIQPINSRLKVYYGWTKINKIRKREAISVIYENAAGAGEHYRYSKTIKKSQETVFVRFQSEEESLDAIHQNRVFTEFSIFMDDKAIGGDLDADKNHVPENTRLEIKELLRRNYHRNHK